METKRLEVGMRFTRGAWTFRIVKRTRCFVTLEWHQTSPWGDVSRKEKRVKVEEWRGGEFCHAPVALGIKLDARESDSDGGRKPLNSSVFAFYTSAFPTDTLGIEIRQTVTFADVLDALSNQRDVYEALGVIDSIVRERVFEELSKRLGKDYDDVYELWLHGDPALTAA